jgi:hypothetical protein
MAKLSEIGTAYFFFTLSTVTVQKHCIWIEPHFGHVCLIISFEACCHLIVMQIIGPLESYWIQFLTHSVERNPHTRVLAEYTELFFLEFAY